jgi:hypothetical protein
VKQDAGRLSPAFYGVDGERRAWADWWLLLHPPYTLWHLSYAAIGASIAPRVDGGRLIATLLAFFLAVGVGAHALDELHGRPLGTVIPRWALIWAAVVGIGGAVGLGGIGVQRVGVGLLVFVVIGAAIDGGYNLELIGGRLHNDIVFGIGWGAFPVVTAYYAQAETIRPATIAAAGAAYALSMAQRTLSTPARSLRRRVVDVDGVIVHRDGGTTRITRATLLDPIESTLKALTWGMVALAVSLVLLRFTDA